MASSIQGNLGYEDTLAVFASPDCFQAQLIWHSTGLEQLVDMPMEFAMNETYHVKVVVESCVIRVYVGDELCLEYEEQERPFLCGSAGVHGLLCNVDIDNFRLMGLEEE